MVGATESPICPILARIGLLPRFCLKRDSFVGKEENEGLKQKYGDSVNLSPL